MASAALLPARSILVPPQQSSPRPPASLRVCLSHHNEPSPDPKRRRDPVPSHPAFSPAARRRAKKIPIADTGEPAAGVHVTDRGLAYRLDGAPFEFQYSYTEAPRARPVALREAPYLPFGPEATPRPWTGRKPLPKSRKEMPEFDSFVLPPPGKKGVKPVQSPGPFLAGMEPRYQAASREEVLGEPLTKEEIAELVNGSLKTKRQLNIGRDGLTHNMLENIHAHWKRKRVCKIKCKGVCTVDMDNVCQQLEDLVPCVLLSFEFEHILMWRGNDWKPSLPLVKENNFEVTKVQEHVSGKELNENVRSSGTVLTQIELVCNERSLMSCSLGEGGGEPKDSMKPNLASDISFSSATEAHTPLECSPSNPGTDFVHPSLKSALRSQTILSE